MVNDDNLEANTFVSATGASLKCDTHGIDTFDLNEWNEHCADPANGHTESGEVPCKDCGKSVNIDGHPHVPITVKGKEFNIRCAECLDKSIEINRAMLNNNGGGNSSQ